MSVRGVTLMFTRSRTLAALTLVLATALPASAQDKTYEIQKPNGTWQVPGEIKQPTGKWQGAGEGKQPTRPRPGPGDIQVPKGIQGGEAGGGSRRGRPPRGGGDPPVGFYKANLRPRAEETLLR